MAPISWYTVDWRHPVLASRFPHALSPVELCWSLLCVQFLGNTWASYVNSSRPKIRMCSKGYPTRRATVVSVAQCGTSVLLYMPCVFLVVTAVFLEGYSLYGRFRSTSLFRLLGMHGPTRTCSRRYPDMTYVLGALIVC